MSFINATPPYLPPELFKEYVVKYDQVLIDMIHKAGFLVRVHCHGCANKVLEMIRDMGADAIDPVEAPGKGGDITLREAKRRLGDRVCLCGNIELHDLEYMQPEEIDALVKQNIEEAGQGGGYILLPTADPINQPLWPKTEKNIMQMVKSARKYGRY